MTMIMSQHGPESAHGCRRNRYPQLGDISGQEGLDERLAPRETVVIGRSKKRTRESASQPQNRGKIRSRFLKVKTGELDEFDTTGKGLRGILHEVGRCAPQNQKPGFVFRAVDQHAQHAKKLGHCLNLINDHETSQGAEHQLRILEAV